jgi:hypothetical protein
MAFSSSLSFLSSLACLELLECYNQRLYLPCLVFSLLLHFLGCESMRSEVKHTALDLPLFCTCFAISCAFFPFLFFIPKVGSPATFFLAGWFCTRLGGILWRMRKVTRANFFSSAKAVQKGFDSISYTKHI